MSGLVWSDHQDLLARCRRTLLRFAALAVTLSLATGQHKLDRIRGRSGAMSSPTHDMLEETDRKPVNLSKNPDPQDRECQ